MMKNLIKGVEKFYNNYFPLISKENIVRRTFMFYGAGFTTLFSTGLTLSNINIFNILLMLGIYFLMFLLIKSFYDSKQFPSFILLTKQFSGFNKFIFIYLCYIGILLVFTSFCFSINDKILQSMPVFIMYAVGFFIIPVIIAIYYLYKSMLKIKSKVKILK